MPASGTAWHLSLWQAQLAPQPHFLKVVLVLALMGLVSCFCLAHRPVKSKTRKRLRISVNVLHNLFTRSRNRRGEISPARNRPPIRNPHANHTKEQSFGFWQPHDAQHGNHDRLPFEDIPLRAHIWSMCRNCSLVSPLRTSQLVPVVATS